MIQGKPHRLREAFEDLLNEESIVALRQALRGVDRQQINAAIDQVLSTLVLGDGSFRNLLIQVLKDRTVASSFHPGVLFCLCNFIEEEDPNLKAIVITGDLATTGLKVDLDKGVDFLEGSSVHSIRARLPASYCCPAITIDTATLVRDFYMPLETGSLMSSSNSIGLGLCKLTSR